MFVEQGYKLHDWKVQEKTSDKKQKFGTEDAAENDALFGTVSMAFYYISYTSKGKTMVNKDRENTCQRSSQSDEPDSFQAHQWQNNGDINERKENIDKMCET